MEEYNDNYDFDNIEIFNSLYDTTPNSPQDEDEPEELFTNDVDEVQEKIPTIEQQMQMQKELDKWKNLDKFSQQFQNMKLFYDIWKRTQTSTNYIKGTIASLKHSKAKKYDWLKEFEDGYVAIPFKRLGNIRVYSDPKRFENFECHLLTKQLIEIFDDPSS